MKLLHAVETETKTKTKIALRATDLSHIGDGRILEVWDLEHGLRPRCYHRALKLETFQWRDKSFACAVA